MGYKLLKIGFPAAVLIITPTTVAVVSNIEYEEFEPVPKSAILNSPRALKIPKNTPIVPSWSPSTPIVVTGTRKVKIGEWPGPRKGTGPFKVIRVKRTRKGKGAKGAGANVATAQRGTTLLKKK